jgi:pimeloyl-ACP methyl ester carboxylesterase
VEVTRHYLVAGGRQVHYRRAGSGAPAVIVHESPLSSARYESLLAALGARHTAIAIDTPGYGESEPLPVPAPEIGDYADALVETLDALGVGRCGLYGAHTGAKIALEVALRAPERVAALVLDGLLPATEDERRELLERYCPMFAPELDGSHLLRAWAMRRDMHLFFPWYRRSADASLALALPDAGALHAGMMDHLRAGAGYHLGYAAAFRHDSPAALRRVNVPTAVVAARDDVLFEHLGRLPRDLPANVVVRERPADLGAALTELFAPAAGLPPAPAPPAFRPRSDRVTRSYATTSQGQLHLRARACDRGRPLLLVHGSPTSAAMVEPLMDRLAGTRPVYAFDTLGNGDSAKPHGWNAPAIADFAAVLAEAIDDVGIGELDLYGTHTGAAIAIETSLLQPGRVGRMILDGVAMFDDATVAEFLERYFIDLEPRTDGSHLVAAWGCVRDSTIWFPWYRRDPEHRYRSDVLGADALHRYALEFLKSGSSYPLPYRAAFTYPAAERLPLVAIPTLIASHREDPLIGFLDRAVTACPGSRGALLPDDAQAAAQLFARFLDDRGGEHG